MAMKRRRNREGTICQRADGRWMARVTLATGERKNLYASSEKEVLRKLDKARRRHQDGLPPIDETTKLGDFLDRWLAECVKPHRAYGTYRAYESHCRIHIRPALGHVRLARLTVMDVQRFVNDLSDASKAGTRKKLSSTTVHRIRATLRRALNHAIRS